MPITTQDIFTHLKHAHIFRRLDDETLNELAMRFQKGRWKAGDVIVEQGEMARHFFFIYYGEVEVIAQAVIDEETVETMHLGKLGVDDYFGESSILEDMEMEASVRAVSEVVLLFLPREEFLTLLEDFPLVYEALLLVEQTRLRVIDWQYREYLGEEEAVFLLVNKHWFWVAVRLILPILSIILVIATTVGVSFFTGVFGWLPMLILLALCAGWIGICGLPRRQLCGYQPARNCRRTVGNFTPRACRSAFVDGAVGADCARYMGPSAQFWRCDRANHYWLGGAARCAQTLPD